MGWSSVNGDGQTGTIVGDSMKCLGPLDPRPVRELDLDLGTQINRLIRGCDSAEKHQPTRRGGFSIIPSRLSWQRNALAMHIWTGKGDRKCSGVAQKDRPISLR